MIEIIFEHIEVLKSTIMCAKEVKRDVEEVAFTIDMIHNRVEFSSRINVFTKFKEEVLKLRPKIPENQRMIRSEKFKNFWGVKETLARDPFISGPTVTQK